MYQRAVMKARVSKALVRMNAIKKQMEIYKTESPSLGSPKVHILYDPNASVAAGWARYEGSSELSQGLTCEGTGSNHVCSDDDFSFYGAMGRSGMGWITGRIEVYEKGSRFPFLAMRNCGNKWEKGCGESSFAPHPSYVCKWLGWGWEGLGHCRVAVPEIIE